MREAVNFEELIAGSHGREVRLRRGEAQELAQKLRARGGTDAAAKLESRLGEEDEIALDAAEAQQVLDELRASGRRWVGGAGRPAPAVVPPSAPKEGVWRRFWRR